MRIEPARLAAFCLEVLRRAGVREADAGTSAEALVTADTWGVFTHGTKLLRGYVKRLRAGGLRANGRPRIEREGPAWAIVDGDSALGSVTSVLAMRTALVKARACGVGYVGVRNSCHFGAAGYYANLAARDGFIGIAMANDIPSVAAPGSRGAVLGSNPLAFAIPHEPDRPILLDMATSTVAGGKVYAATALGRPIPEGWLLDDRGLPTRDPSWLSRGGSLTPMAAHKGYGIALLIETLSGVLTGAATTWQVLSWAFQDPAKPTDHGAAFIALDVNAIMPNDQFRPRIAHVAAEIRAAPTAPGVERVLLPGDLEWACRDRAIREGIRFPDDVMEALSGLAQDLEMELPAELRGLDDSAKTG